MFLFRGLKNNHHYFKYIMIYSMSSIVIDGKQSYKKIQNVIFDITHLQKTIDLLLSLEIFNTLAKCFSVFGPIVSFL